MKSKLSLLLILITLFAILLAGCRGSGAATVIASNGPSSAIRLVLGTFELEDTSQAVTAAQAANLLTLWEGYQSLSNSDTSSQLELDALVKQIQGAMTADQIKAIDAMELSDQSVSEVMSSLGGSVNATTPANIPGASASSQAAPDGGPGGMPGGGGDSVMSAIGGGLNTQSTPAVTQSTTSASTTQVNPMLIQGLIKLL
jgi:hypothetical protein